MRTPPPIEATTEDVLDEVWQKTMTVIRVSFPYFNLVLYSKSILLSIIEVYLKDAFFASIEEFDSNVL